MFENVEIKINNADESGGNYIDYSGYEVNDQAMLSATCSMVSEISVPEWRRPKGMKAYKATNEKGEIITQPGAKFDFWLKDNKGKDFTVAIECPLKITFGKNNPKMRSKLYKTLKALAPTKPEEVFQSDASVKSLLNAMGAYLAKEGNAGIPCMVQISVEELPATEKYKANKRIKILEVFPQPTQAQFQAEPVKQEVKKDDFDEDSLPF